MLCNVNVFIQSDIIEVNIDLESRFVRTELGDILFLDKYSVTSSQSFECPQ